MFESLELYCRTLSQVTATRSGTSVAAALAIEDLTLSVTAVEFRKREDDGALVGSFALDRLFTGVYELGYWTVREQRFY